MHCAKIYSICFKFAVVCCVFKEILPNVFYCIFCINRVWWLPLKIIFLCLPSLKAHKHWNSKDVQLLNSNNKSGAWNNKIQNPDLSNFVTKVCEFLNI